MAVKIFKKWKRAPGSDDCQEYEKGEQSPISECQTDGHYLCTGCKHRTLTPGPWAAHYEENN